MLIPEESVPVTGAMEDSAQLERTLRRDVALLSEGFRSSAATSRWSDVRVVLSDGACDAHRLVLASASCLLGAALSEEVPIKDRGNDDYAVDTQGHIRHGSADSDGTRGG